MQKSVSDHWLTESLHHVSCAHLCTGKSGYNVECVVAAGAFRTIFREYSLASLISSYSFPVSKVIFQFPVTSLWQDYRLRVTLDSPGVEALCTLPIRRPRCVASAKLAKKYRMTNRSFLPTNCCWDRVFDCLLKAFMLWHVCVKEALQCVCCMSRHAAITKPRNQWLCVALPLFKAKLPKTFWSFLPHNRSD